VLSTFLVLVLDMKSRLLHITRVLNGHSGITLDLNIHVAISSSISISEDRLHKCHGQTRQEQESERNVWFIVNCRLRNKRGKDPSYLSYVGKRMKWRQNISGAGSGAETWVGLVLAPGS